MLHPLNLGRYPQCLRSIIDIALQIKRSTLFFLRIDGFLYLMYILMNQRISCIDDGLRRTIIALQLKEPCFRINLPEIEDIAYIRSAERINGLRIISDHADIILRLCQLFYQKELNIIRILILIHQDILELLLVFLSCFRTFIQEPQHVNQQVIKIHRIRSMQASLIQGIHSSKLIHPYLAVFTLELLVATIFFGTYSAVFHHRDTSLHCRRFIDFLIQAAFFTDAFDDRFYIGCVINRKVSRITQLLRVGSYQARANTMESAHDEIARIIRGNEFDNAFFHLTCCFVGEGQRHDTPCRHTLPQQIRDAVRQHTRLTRTGSGYDERSSLGTSHRLTLRII